MKTLHADPSLNPQDILRGLLADAWGRDWPAAAHVRPARSTGQGDFTTNLAMVVPTGGNARPRDLAQALADHVAQDPRIAAVQVGGQGFLNVTFDTAVWQDFLQSVSRAPVTLGEDVVSLGLRQRSCPRVLAVFNAVAGMAAALGLRVDAGPPHAAVFVERLDHHTIDDLRAAGQHSALHMVGEVRGQDDMAALTDRLGAQAAALALLCRPQRKPFDLDVVDVSRDSLHNPVFRVLHARDQLTRDLAKCAGGSAAPAFTAVERLILPQIAAFWDVLSRAFGAFSVDIFAGYLLHLADLTHQMRAIWQRFPQHDPRNPGISAPVLAKSALLDALLLVISTGLCILTSEFAP